MTLLLLSITYFICFFPLYLVIFVKVWKFGVFWLEFVFVCVHSHSRMHVSSGMSVALHQKVTFICYLWPCLRQSLSFIVWLYVFQDIRPINFREFSSPFLHVTTQVLGLQTQAITLALHGFLGFKLGSSHYCGKHHTH